MSIDLVETRSLTVELSVTEWLALRTVERDPVAYLKQQIARRLESDESRESRERVEQPAYSQTDEY